MQGLGPRFKLLITLRNDGATHVRDVPLLLVYNEGLYTTPRRHLMVPLLVPTISYTLEVGVNKCVVGAGKRGREWWLSGKGTGGGCSTTPMPLDGTAVCADPSAARWRWV